MTTLKAITQGMALLSALVVSITITAASYGQVIVEDTNIELTTDPGFSPTLTISQRVSSSAGDSTSVLLGLELIDGILPVEPIPIPIGLTAGPVALDEGADLYVAQAGDIFSLSTINTGNFQPLLEGATVSSANVFAGEDFFLAIATTETALGLPSPGFERDVFGWARLNIDPSTLDITLLDNAAAYGTGNIIVGQNAFAIPEPSSGIALATLLGLGVVRRRKR